MKEVFVDEMEQFMVTAVSNGSIPDGWADHYEISIQDKVIKFRNLKVRGTLTRFLPDYEIEFHYVAFASGISVVIVPTHNAGRPVETALQFHKCSIEFLRLTAFDLVKIEIFQCYEIKTIELNVRQLQLNVNLPSQGDWQINRILISTPEHAELFPSFSANSWIKIANAKVDRIVIKKPDTYVLHFDSVVVEKSTISVSTIDANVGLMKINKSHFKTLYIKNVARTVDIDQSNFGELLNPGLNGDNYRFSDSAAQNLAFSEGCDLGTLSIVGKISIGNLLFGLAMFRTISVTGFGELLRIILPFTLTKFDVFVIRGNKLRTGLSVTVVSFEDGLLLKGKSESKSSVVLENFRLGKLSFNQTRNEGNIFISRVDADFTSAQRVIPEISTVFLREFTRHAIVFDDRKFNVPTFSIIESDLGKINFISCDFSKMVLRFEASKIVDIFLSGTLMPERIDANFESQQTGYSQLKKVYENRGDSVQSLNYLKLELSSHLNSLRTISWKDKTSQQKMDFIILTINRFSNEFGTSYQSWWIATAVMVVIFVLHNLSLGYTVVLPASKGEWYNLLEISALFFEFIYPIHKADFIPEAVGMTPKIGSRLIDLIGRVFSGYFIYQYIQVFRKYGKK